MGDHGEGIRNPISEPSLSGSCTVKRSAVCGLKSARVNLSCKSAPAPLHENVTRAAVFGTCVVCAARLSILAALENRPRDLAGLAHPRPLIGFRMMTFIEASSPGAGVLRAGEQIRVDRPTALRSNRSSRVDRRRFFANGLSREASALGGSLLARAFKGQDLCEGRIVGVAMPAPP